MATPTPNNPNAGPSNANNTQPTPGPSSTPTNPPIPTATPSEMQDFIIELLKAKLRNPNPTLTHATLEGLHRSLHLMCQKRDAQLLPSLHATVRKTMTGEPLTNAETTLALNSTLSAWPSLALPADHSTALTKPHLVTLNRGLRHSGLSIDPQHYNQALALWVLMDKTAKRKQGENDDSMFGRLAGTLNVVLIQTERKQILPTEAEFEATKAEVEKMFGEIATIPANLGPAVQKRKSHKELVVRERKLDEMERGFGTDARKMERVRGEIAKLRKEVEWENFRNYVDWVSGKAEGLTSGKKDGEGSGKKDGKGSGKKDGKGSGKEGPSKRETHVSERGLGSSGRSGGEERPSRQDVVRQAIARRAFVDDEEVDEDENRRMEERFSRLRIFTLPRRSGTRASHRGADMEEEELNSLDSE